MKEKLENKLTGIKTEICEQPSYICKYGDDLLNCSYRLQGEPYCAHRYDNPHPAIVFKYKLFGKV